MTPKNDWFQVDKEGLAQVYARRGPAAPFYELISNAWDEDGVTQVALVVVAERRSPFVSVVCVDNAPKGFADLDEARTLFAPSCKKGDAERRGRFNVGEKLFLSLCRSATIQSTGGALHFREDGSVSKRTTQTTEEGTVITAELRMTRADARLAFDELSRMISPDGITTTVSFQGWPDDSEAEQGGELWYDSDRETKGGDFSFEATLQTETANDEGQLGRTERKARVEAYETCPGETGWLFEMGVPVVAIGCPFDLNVKQKVPLTIDRDNVRPAFTKRLLAHALNHGHACLVTSDQAKAAWITHALASKNPEPTPEAIGRIMDLRFGRKRVAFDPSDPEGTKIAASKGYTVVPGGAMPREAWANVKAAGAIERAGKVTPSPKVLHDAQAEDDRVPLESVEGGVEVAAIFRRIAGDLTGRSIEVSIRKRIQMSGSGNAAACYGGRHLSLSLQALGRGWFAPVAESLRVERHHVELLLHELGHEYADDHLDEKFHESQSKMGADLAFEAGASLGDYFAVDPDGTDSGHWRDGR